MKKTILLFFVLTASVRLLADDNPDPCLPNGESALFQGPSYPKNVTLAKDYGPYIFENRPTTRENGFWPNDEGSCPNGTGASFNATFREYRISENGYYWVQSGSLLYYDYNIGTSYLYEESRY